MQPRRQPLDVLPEGDATTRSILLALALAKFGVHLITSAGYGYFRDELYYLACSDQLALGYVDQPPLSIFFLAVQRFLLGDSLIALRFLPALAGGITVYFVGLTTRALGGGLFAQVFAMLAVITAPIYLALDHIYSMNAFDLMFWSIAAYLVVRILRKPRPELWMLLGLTLGLGLLNKLSVLWLIGGLFVGFALTPSRRHLMSPWPWISAGIAGVLFLPHVLWQIDSGWPTLEFMRNAQQLKMAPTLPLDFLRAQLLLLNPISLPIWGLGLLFFFWFRGGRRFQPLGWAWLVIFLMLVLSGSSRAYYLAPAYLWLFAGGAISLELLFERAGGLVGGALRSVYTAAVLVTGVLLAPLAIPVLPVPLYIEYARTLGFEPSTEERKEIGELPQFYADMHGWKQITRTVAKVYNSLKLEDRQRAAIFCPNYGVAGAIDFFGRQHDLPPAISGHNSYWLWGPRGYSGEVVIVVGGSEDQLRTSFESVELADSTNCGYCMPYEDQSPIWVCRKLRTSLEEAWAGVKHYD